MTFEWKFLHMKSSYVVFFVEVNCNSLNTSSLLLLRWVGWLVRCAVRKKKTKNKNYSSSKIRFADLLKIKPIQTINVERWLVCALHTYTVYNCPLFFISFHISFAGRKLEFLMLSWLILVLRPEMIYIIPLHSTWREKAVFHSFVAAAS